MMDLIMMIYTILFYFCSLPPGYCLFYGRCNSSWISARSALAAHATLPRRKWNWKHQSSSPPVAHGWPRPSVRQAGAIRRRPVACPCRRPIDQWAWDRRHKRTLCHHQDDIRDKVCPVKRKMTSVGFTFDFESIDTFRVCSKAIISVKWQLNISL